METQSVTGASNSFSSKHFQWLAGIFAALAEKAPPGSELQRAYEAAAAADLKAAHHNNPSNDYKAYEEDYAAKARYWRSVGNSAAAAANARASQLCAIAAGPNATSQQRYDANIAGQKANDYNQGKVADANFNPLVGSAIQNFVGGQYVSLRGALNGSAADNPTALLSLELAAGDFSTAVLRRLRWWRARSRLWLTLLRRLRRRLVSSFRKKLF